MFNWKQLIDHVQIDWQYDAQLFRPTTFDIGTATNCITAIYEVPENLSVIQIAIQVSDIFSNTFFSSL